MYELLYDYRPGDEHDFSLQPLVQFSYRHSSVDAFAAHGSNAGMQANPGDMDIFTLAAGARLQAVVGQNMYNCTSLFECRALLSWDMGNRRGESRVALLHGSGRENVQGSRPGLLGAELGAGLTVPLGAESGSLFLDASITLRSRAYEVNAVAGYSLTF
jgi:outer membrane autotransporter protein